MTRGHCGRVRSAAGLHWSADLHCLDSLSRDRYPCATAAFGGGSPHLQSRLRGRGVSDASPAVGKGAPWSQTCGGRAVAPTTWAPAPRELVLSVCCVTAWGRVRPINRSGRRIGAVWHGVRAVPVLWKPDIMAPGA
uniref:Uncharacterized protein n=1 Tax=Eutreptiella gymnastica TaxID=73025 RepID=A0A7S4LGX3_9EUGL